MDLRQILLHGGTLVVDPSLMRSTPDEFLAQYGSYMDSVCLVAKSETGSTYYPSFTAPKDPQFGDFFSSFAQIANDIGIKVYAELHANVDYYLSRDSNFAMVKSGGQPIKGYVCPARQPYWYYLSEIAAEIVQYPVDGIILKDALYPQLACFCESCRREFLEVDKFLDRDFGYERLEAKPETLTNWYRRRLQSLSGMVGSIINRVNAQRQIEVFTEILLDPQVSYMQGAASYFAQDINYLSQVSSHMLLHIHPWTPELPVADSPEMDAFINAIAPIRDRGESINNSLYFWNTTEATLEFAEIVRSILGSQNTFYMDQAPPSYSDRRSYQLGIF